MSSVHYVRGIDDSLSERRADFTSVILVSRALGLGHAFSVFSIKARPIADCRALVFSVMQWVLRSCAPSLISVLLVLVAGRKFREKRLSKTNLATSSASQSSLGALLSFEFLLFFFSLLHGKLSLERPLVGYDASKTPTCGGC